MLGANTWVSRAMTRHKEFISSWIFSRVADRIRTMKDVNEAFQVTPFSLGELQVSLFKALTGKWNRLSGVNKSNHIRWWAPYLWVSLFQTLTGKWNSLSGLSITNHIGWWALSLFDTSEVSICVFWDKEWDWDRGRGRETMMMLVYYAWIQISAQIGFFFLSFFWKTNLLLLTY